MEEIKRVNIVANIEPKSDKDEFLDMLTNFTLQELFILNEELRKRLSCEFKEEI
jgi:hypothetical protein